MKNVHIALPRLGYASVLACVACALAVTASEALATGAVASCRHVSDAYSKVVLADSPVAYYRLDEAGGPTLCDSSSSANNGTYSSAGIRFGVHGALRKSSDTAIVANGTSGVVGQSRSQPRGLTGNHDFTLEAWFRNTETTLNNHVLVALGVTCSAEVSGQSCNGKTVNNGQAVALALFPHHAAQLGRGPASCFGVDQQGADYCWDATSVGVNLWDGKWHYLAVTYNHTKNQFTGYVDSHDLGQPVSDVFGNPAVNIAAAPIRLGQWFNTFHEPLVGGLDEVAVYATALSSKRIAAHFAAAR